MNRLLPIDELPENAVVMASNSGVNAAALYKEAGRFFDVLGGERIHPLPTRWRVLTKEEEGAEIVKLANYLADARRVFTDGLARLTDTYDTRRDNAGSEG